MLKEYTSENIRNVAIIGHGGTGKSTLFEAMLYVGGMIDKMGDTDKGTLVSDYDEEEKKRKLSLKNSMGFIEYNGVKINVIDTPGTGDFVGESRAALQVVDTAILVVDSVDGVQIETEKAWRFLKANNIPRIIFVNKMDKERANYDNVINNLKNSLKVNAASLCIPVGEGEAFMGVVDTTHMKMMEPKGDGRDVDVHDIPDDLMEIAQLERSNLLEQAAEGDDELIEKFLEGEELTDEEIQKGIDEQMIEARLSPVICGSATKHIGIKNLLNVIKDYVPSPAVKTEYVGHNMHDSSKEIKIKSNSGEFMTAVVWKTVIDQYSGRINYFKVTSGSMCSDCEILNSSKDSKERLSKVYSMQGGEQHDTSKLNCGDIGVVFKLAKTITGDTLCDSKQSVILPILSFPEPVFSYAISAANKNDEDKLGEFINRATDEQPTITYSYNAETRESVLSGMGEFQLNILLTTLKEKNKLEVVTKEPRVAYRETITKSTEAQYKHKKQSGGHGQYGEVYLRMKPLSRGGGFEFKDSIVGGVVPKNYIPGVQKGLKEAQGAGVLASFPVVDISCELFDGSYHAVDSSEMAFKIAARQAFKKGMQDAGPQILEPVMEVSVFVDKDFMGDILNDITGRRGKVLGMENAAESGGNVSVVKATIPLAEMLRYTIDLRSMTSGKGSFEMEFSHYDPISGRTADNIIAERKKMLEEDN